MAGVVAALARLADSAAKSASGFAVSNKIAGLASHATKIICLPIVQVNPTRQPIAPVVPMKIKRWNGFSVTNVSQNGAKNLFKDLPAKGCCFRICRGCGQTTARRSLDHVVGSLAFRALHCTATSTRGRNGPKTVGYPERFAQEGFGAQQQGGASCLRQTRPDENSIVGGI